MTIGEKPSYAYINCLRGYAILLVITSHLPYSYPELPYPVRRLSLLGMTGVQLFFLTSCVTLLMSWRGEVSRLGRADIGAFFLRRAFRIIPTYYLGGLFYLWLDPPAHGFDLARFLTAYGFVNLWLPLTAPTMGQWAVIPGGWSVSVEFTFYALFPLIALLVTTLRRAIVFTLVALVLAILANRAGFLLWRGAYSTNTNFRFLPSARWCSSSSARPSISSPHGARARSRWWLSWLFSRLPGPAFRSGRVKTLGF
jgi:peptidoglycan/LPS O-acetylase OafA/YrhL